VSVLVPITREVEEGRDPGALVSFRRLDGKKETWADFASQVVAARLAIRAEGSRSWVLYADDCYAFDVGLSALLREGKRILVPGGAQAGLVAAIRGEGSALIGDGAFDPASGPALDLRAIIDAPAAPQAPADALHDLGPSRSSEASLELFTSGSTGSPKSVPKRMGQIEAEIAALYELWGADLEGRLLYSTVSQQHIYGLLFFGLLPICSGTAFCSERIAYPESLSALAEAPSALVASPAFLKRAVEAGVPPLPEGRDAVSFSSGGVLPQETGAAAAELLGRRVMEIYGSSETGGITYRPSASGLPWRPFKGIDLRIAEDGRIQVRSPYLAETGFIAIDDLGSLSNDGGLTLLGRADSVVKIEEKRVSLVEIETRLRETGLVADVHALALESGGRQIIGAVLVLKGEGRELLVSGGRRAVVSALRERLGAYFAPVLLPRKWRFVEALKVNEQGKLRRDAMRALFEGKEPPYDILSSNRPGSSAGELELELLFPPECPYFDGHFPSYKILPAVAQIDIVMRLARERLGAPKEMLGMPRVKFQKPMSPGIAYSLKLSHDSGKGRTTFAFAESISGDACSSGKIDVAAGPTA
jgi:acyl-coenzyme A synthetase/AMP-(fatty) acid ligase/3-hydroxymyristoyl/3-hydroxydecanoyl-(acyl carrier protein) dehydratase